MSKKLKILLYANVYETTVGQSIPYMEFFSQFGDVILVTSEMEVDEYIQLGDVLALPGGMDLSSIRYGKKPGFNSRYVNNHYEYLDTMLLEPWLSTGKPIIGICRGMQALNIALGGTLHRHIDGHVQDAKLARSATPDEVYTDLYGVGPNALDFRIQKTNSYHHQAVEKLGEGLVVLGWSHSYVGCPSLSSDNSLLKHVYYKSKSGEIKRTTSKYEVIIEIVRHKTKPYVAFQYHPEEFNCELANLLIKETLHSYYGEKYQISDSEKEGFKILNNA